MLFYGGYKAVLFSVGPPYVCYNPSSRGNQFPLLPALSPRQKKQRAQKSRQTAFQKPHQNTKLLDIPVAAVETHFRYPVFVKPSNAGSSRGVNKAETRRELIEALKEAAEKASAALEKAQQKAEALTHILMTVMPKLLTMEEVQVL